MTRAAMKQTALNVSSATAELITKILAQFPQAQIRPRSVPLTDEDISLEVVLPMSMAEIYQAREWIYDIVIELQDRYDLIIMASAVPQEGQENINPQ
jgi:hypothetical protein